MAFKPALDVMMDASPSSDVVLPPTLQPTLPPVRGSLSASQFYLLKDGKTGVLALGSFSDADYLKFVDRLLQGLVSLKSQGATQLVVDVVRPILNWLTRRTLMSVLDQQWRGFHLCCPRRWTLARVTVSH